MNDDFLYRIRTEPPPYFARTLKERLDRLPKRGAKLASFGLGLFLFGTAFALVSPAARELVTGWLGGNTEDDGVALVAAPSAAKRVTSGVPPAAAAPSSAPAVRPPAFSPPVLPDEGEFPPDRITLTREEVAFAVQMDNERPRPEERAARTLELLENLERHMGVQPQTAASTSYEESAGSQNELITSGPLLAEVGPAYAFTQRRALFTVMAWTVEPVYSLIRRQSEFDDVRKFEVAGRRLEQLARMIPDSFAQDTRRSNVPTRALERVWQDPGLFAKRVEEMEIAARLLTIAAQKGNESGVRQAANRVAFTCMKCHEEFRENGNDKVGESYP